jgi:sec-independent protein translocase protein TatC
VGVVEHEERLTLVEHLEELRSRIFISLIALAVGFFIAVLANDLVFRLLLRPLQQPRIPETARKLLTLSPSEPFMTSLKVWVYVGVMLAVPVIIYEFWAFVGPAFAPTQKRTVLPVVGICTFLFLFGVAFGYLVVLPRGLGWLLGFNSEVFQTQNQANAYFSFAAWFLVAFGAVFEMPVIIVASVRLGIVDTRFLRRNRRYAIVVMAIIAAIATPSQDAFSMLAMLVPLLILYEISLVVARFMEPHGAETINWGRAAIVFMVLGALGYVSVVLFVTPHTSGSLWGRVALIAVIVYEVIIVAMYVSLRRWSRRALQKNGAPATVDTVTAGNDTSPEG